MISFVYRTHYEGPLGKRVRRLPDDSVLHWFRRAWAAVVDEPGRDIQHWLDAELGGPVYGLHTVFREAREQRLPAPRDWRELATVLRDHLYYEGELRADEHGVRVCTDDDEVELCYFFFDDALAGLRPERAAYLLHESWPLPGDAAGDPLPAGSGETHAAFLTFYDSDSICWQPPITFPGVRLPDLAAHLRAATAGLEGWPLELVVLRALLAPHDTGLGEALARCNHWPSFGERTPSELYGPHETAHAYAMRVLEGGKPDRGRDPARTLLAADPHLAQMSMHADDYFGHQQWFLFDDVWAARHEHLSGSLLHYAAEWDPFC
uniref:hypothetical protein n=1 Tax=Nonomuraea pusilla TaxID=46177 RepID=UPI0006E19847|nr:hypothetical protein [Nonomuraea pusilla]